MPEGTPKPKCPSCGVELEGEPESCAKCGFEIKDYKGFYRMFRAAMKQSNSEDAAEKAAAEAEAAKNKPKKGSVMDNLLGKKREAAQK